MPAPAAPYARALVTGHTGFKGAWLSSRLLARGVEVAGLSLAPDDGRPSLFVDLVLDRRMESRLGDIRDLATVREAVDAFRPEVVFHLAAQALVRRSYADPVGTFATNVLGTAHIYEAARTCDSVRAIVCVTTDKVYENREWVWRYREVDRLGGKDPYSASKAAAELVASSYARTLLTGTPILAATARGGNVIGGGDWSEDRLVPDVVRSFRAGEPLTLRNPAAVRPWQHVLELVRGYELLADRLAAGDRSAAEAWNFGPTADNEVEVGVLVEAMRRVWGGDAPPVRVEPAPAMPEAQQLRLDIAKAQARLGWSPVLDFAETIGWTTDWYRRWAVDRTQAQALVAEQIALYDARVAAQATGAAG